MVKLWRSGCLVLACVGVLAGPGAAHAAVVEWDAVVGPMAVDARRSLASGDPGPIMQWVNNAQRPQATAALTKTRQLRAKYPEQVERLDRAFFGTLITLTEGDVRVR